MRILSLILVLLAFGSCKPEAGKVEYGKEGCSFCSMTIVDNQHAAQIVTDKGKIFKFDAIECMLNDLKKRDKSKVAMVLVNDYSNPGQFISAQESTFVISKAIPSPMGAFLSAFNEREAATLIQKEKGGDLYDWESIQAKFK